MRCGGSTGSELNPRNPHPPISNNPFTMAQPPPPGDGSPRAIIINLFESVRRGSAGFGTRLGLSLASATAAVGVLNLVLGLADYALGRVREEHVAIGVVVVLLAWIGVLYPIWATYSRKRHLVKTILACLAVVVFTIGTGMAFGFGMRNPEFFIAATILLGASGLFSIVTAAAHARARGREIIEGGIAVRVLCPRCSYSMSGLESSTCPECGARYTLDELIRAQDYDALRPDRTSRELPNAASGDAAVAQTSNDLVLQAEGLDRQ